MSKNIADFTRPVNDIFNPIDTYLAGQAGAAGGIGSDRSLFSFEANLSSGEATVVIGDQFVRT